MVLNQKTRRIAKSFLVVFLLVGLLFVLNSIYVMYFPKNDYAIFIRKNIALFLEGQNPYDGPGPYNPPWLYLLLSPLLILPDSMGAAILTLANLLALSFLLFRSKTSLLVFVMVLFSPVTFSLIMTSNVDGLLMLGVLLPPEWGLFLILSKPQLGLGIALYWAWEAFRSGGIRQLLKIFAPVSFAFLLSFAVYGIYLLRGRFLVSAGWNVNQNLFPYLVLPALALLFVAVAKNRFSLSFGAGPLFSPYATPNSYVGLIPAFAWNWKLALTVWLLEWAVFFRQFIF